MNFLKKPEAVELTKEVLIKDYPNLYNSITSELSEKITKLEGEVLQLTHIVEKNNNKEKNLASALKLGLTPEEVKDIIDLPVAEAMVKMIDLAEPKIINSKNLFKQSAPPAAGVDAGTLEVPKTFDACIKEIMQRDSVNAMEASKRAQTEFPEIFSNIYKQMRKGE